MRVWLVRVAWITLPLTAGPALSAGLHDWSATLRVVGAVLCWLAWSVGLLATLAPRPAGLTALRVVAPLGIVATIVAATSGRPSALAAAAAVAATLVAGVLAADPAFALAAANGVAYGDERRFPLRVPPSLFLGPLPAARALVVAGLVAGPLVLGTGRVVWGLVALVLGLPSAALAAAALHRLSRRWMVLVPAGVVVVDRMALVDNVLFPREHVVRMRPFDADEAPGDALDLRFGAALGSVLLVFDEPAELVRAVRPRRGAETVRAPALVVAVSQRRDLLEAASKRRVRVELADPVPMTRRATPPPGG